MAAQLSKGAPAHARPGPALVGTELPHRPGVDLVLALEHAAQLSGDQGAAGVDAAGGDRGQQHDPHAARRGCDACSDAAWGESEVYTWSSHTIHTRPSPSLERSAPCSTALRSPQKIMNAK